MKKKVNIEVPEEFDYYLLKVIDDNYDKLPTAPNFVDLSRIFDDEVFVRIEICKIPEKMKCKS